MLFPWSSNSWRILMKSRTNYIRILWSSKLLDNKTGHQNSDRNLWRIPKHFLGHLILVEFHSHLNCWIIRLAGHQNSDWNHWKFSWQFCGHLILVEFHSHLNCWIIRLAGHQNSDWNHWKFSWQFCGHLILVEFHSHLNCWIIRLATRILIKIIENFGTSVL